MDETTERRRFLRSDGWDVWRQSETDQRRGVPAPAPELPIPPGARVIDLVAPQDLSVGRMPLIETLRRRRSHRSFTPEALTLEELSFLLWATQGVSEAAPDGGGTRRTVPSGGARHPFETFVCAERVQGVEPGLYRYLPLEHRLCLVRSAPGLYEEVNDATNTQNFGGAVVFMWTAIPYRSEWRYSFLAQKLVAIEAGHVCQNLYLACTAIGAGACALDAYDQRKADEVLGVDGVDQFTIYCATVGKL